MQVPLTKTRCGRRKMQEPIEPVPAAAGLQSRGLRSGFWILGSILDFDRTVIMIGHHGH